MRLNDVKNIVWTGLAIYLSFIVTDTAIAKTWECPILPSEQKVIIDKTSGARIIYITSDKASDTNLYFHDRCWLANGQMMLFYSDRTGRSELHAYILSSGELVRLNRAEDSPARSAIASRRGNKMFVIRDKKIYQWTVQLTQKPKTMVNVSEKEIGKFPEGSKQHSGLNENSDGTLVCFGYGINDRYYIAVASTESGETRVVAQPEIPFGHLQFSWNRPDLLSFSGSYGGDTAPMDPNEPPHARIWFVNINTQIPIPAFYQKPGELATHECWWINDQMTFIGGHRKEEAHLKVLDLKTGDIRIIGAGAWWAEGEPIELGKVNWWHAAGSPNGRWIAADNWHGIIALFNAKTTEMKILTQGHRIYGSGAHPHVGWGLDDNSVEFTSNKFGNPDVCIAFIPEQW
jgi:oligogalacturonide lyase